MTTDLPGSPSATFFRDAAGALFHRSSLDRPDEPPTLITQHPRTAQALFDGIRGLKVSDEVSALRDVLTEVTGR